MLFEPVDLSSPDLLGQPIDDLNARQAAFMDSPIESLPGEGLLMHRAVGVAIEEAAELVLQFIDAFDRTVDGLPGEFLIVEPLDRQGVVWGKSVSVRLDFGGRRIHKK